MGRAWFGVAIVCGLGGCGDDEPSWVPPLEEAGAVATSGRSLDAGHNTIDTSSDGVTHTASDGPVTSSSVAETRNATNGVGLDAGVADAGAKTLSHSSEMRDAAEDRSDEVADAIADVATANDVRPDGSPSSETQSSVDSGLDPNDSTAPFDTQASNDAATKPPVSFDLDAGTLDSTESSSPDASNETEAADGGKLEELEARAGFIDLEGVQYTLGAATQASSARLFYAFTPADHLAADAPVFVFFNGGPGSATTAGLLSYGTGPFSLPADLRGPTLEPNPWSWTRMGNLLYFDTRQAGFSYSTLPDPSDPVARSLEWQQRNYNIYIDAADSIRLVLRVLEQEPSLRDNPIILVGESYGGTRATMMLRFLLNPGILRAGGSFQDLALADEITAFFSSNMVEGTNSVEEQAKLQLPAQILIQPFFAGTQFPDQDDVRCLPDSPAQQIAAELGTNCESIELYRDAYKINEPATWSDTLDVLAQQTLMHPTKLTTLLGVPLSSIAGLAAAERPLAYRDSQSGFYASPQPEFLAALGELQAWDAYHLTLTPRGPWSNDLYYDNVPCAYFSWVAQHVNTLITNAKWDNVVLTSVLPTTLYACSQLYSTPFVDGVAFEPEGLALGESGQMVFSFNDEASRGAGPVGVEIRGYDAGHMVTVTHAEPLFKDVQAFLTAHGVL